MNQAEKKQSSPSPRVPSPGETDLFAQTLRTVAILVGACVLFVGALSTAAVVVAEKAVGPSVSEGDRVKSSAAEPSPPAPKKPLSI
jgi:hypothetical protein